MPVFSDTQQMYDTLGTLFERLLEDEVVGPKFKSDNIVIRFNIHDPSGQIWISAAGVVCGEADWTPQIEMTLSGDTCHLFWLKKVNLPVALAKGLIKAKGPMPKIMKLLPMLKPAYEMYPELARSKGLPVD